METVKTKLTGKHLLTLLDFTPTEVAQLLEEAKALKAALKKESLTLFLLASHLG